MNDPGTDMWARLGAYTSLRATAQLADDPTYETLMTLIGRKNPRDHENFTEDELHLLRLLAGPHSRTIVKMLLARKATSLIPV